MLAGDMILTGSCAFPVRFVPLNKFVIELLTNGYHENDTDFQHPELVCWNPFPPL